MGCSSATNDVLSGISNGGLATNISTAVLSIKINETARADILRRKRFEPITMTIALAVTAISIATFAIRQASARVIEMLQDAVNLKMEQIKEEKRKILRHLRNVTGLLSEQMDIVASNFETLTSAFGQMEDQLAGIALNTEVIAGATYVMANIHESRAEKHPIGLCLQRVNQTAKKVYYYSSLAKDNNMVPYMTVENLPQKEAYSDSHRVWCINHAAPACTLLRAHFAEPKMNEILILKPAMLFQCHHLKITESSCINLNTNFDPVAYKEPYCYDAAYPLDYNRFPR
uniref:Envelope protein n=1 Tax=Romanomermis culicivorax TaxID=13658 RepID=A0A915JW69_ROMCU